ncbi:DNA mismatch repair protein MutS [Halalkaliarchaeum desulfuricum]|uniref:DNA mismatch repair protein MutS n=1 Tax=Halalkaliarchaeum desulfuricum TaxID=2055893 RepID=A0A343TMZ5_9EURY|nr:DNA mismatch repair protein [Halalkaliarchaeum desulfuricum]AUX10467.1 DNA mismatch repair protein MutS [Halalkaliarchaeum desulfuricum]
MQLEAYWGVGPKTRERLEAELGAERAVEAIESADIGALVDAGIPRGRVVRILRRANADGDVDRFGTSDARDVYDELLSLAASYALTERAGDRIRVMSPLSSDGARRERLETVTAARDAWIDLEEPTRERVTEAFAAYDDAGATDRAAVRAALSLREAGFRGGTFGALADLDEGGLSDAADALGAVRLADSAPPGAAVAEADSDDLAVRSGTDGRLDRLREELEAVEELENAAFDVIETVRERGAQDLEAFQSGVVEYVASETGLSTGEIRSAAPDDAVDASDYVSRTLRELVAEQRERVTDREREVAAELQEDVATADEDVEAAIAAVDDIAFALSLGRFAAAHDLQKPTLVDEAVLAVSNARNLFLSGEVQPVTYAVGEHDLAGTSNGGEPAPPSGDRVAVLTGANSGGKTTLLETLCQVTLLADMGLPVPADRATVGRFDTVVFHRRHASFNAGVLESTLKSIVPPLSDEDRTLMLVDEFEAITEPGRAADLLNGLVELTVSRDALGVYVTHLADDLSPLPDSARVDGIFAEGLTQDLELEVDYQPRFGTIGKSTPEFIVSRLVANARDRAARQGFEKLAEAVGEEAVQRTLSDARWER